MIHSFLYVSSRGGESTWQIINSSFRRSLRKSGFAMNLLSAFLAECKASRNFSNGTVIQKVTVGPRLIIEVELRQ